MSFKNYCHHVCKEKIILKRIAYGVSAVAGLIVLIFIVRNVLKPSKPSFVLQNATLYSFNLTSPTQLTSFFQVTVQARNPNKHAGIYYDSLFTWATYHHQPISLPTSISPTYQDTNRANTWSLVFQGQSVQIAPFIGSQINYELQSGSVHIVIKIDGLVRFRVGPFTSGPRSIHVNCPAYIPMGNPNIEIPAIKYQFVQECSVSV